MDNKPTAAEQKLAAFMELTKEINSTNQIIDPIYSGYSSNIQSQPRQEFETTFNKYSDPNFNLYYRPYTTGTPIVTDARTTSKSPFLAMPMPKAGAMPSQVGQGFKPFDIDMEKFKEGENVPGLKKALYEKYNDVLKMGSSLQGYDINDPSLRPEYERYVDAYTEMMRLADNLKTGLINAKQAAELQKLGFTFGELSTDPNQETTTGNLRAMRGKEVSEDAEKYTQLTFSDRNAYEKHRKEVWMPAYQSKLSEAELLKSLYEQAVANNDYQKADMYYNRYDGALRDARVIQSREPIYNMEQDKLALDKKKFGLDLKKSLKEVQFSPNITSASTVINENNWNPEGKNVLTGGGLLFFEGEEQGLPVHEEMVLPNGNIKVKYKKTVKNEDGVYVDEDFEKELTPKAAFQARFPQKDHNDLNNWIRTNKLSEEDPQASIFNRQIRDGSERSQLVIDALDLDLYNGVNKDGSKKPVQLEEEQKVSLIRNDIALLQGEIMRYIGDENTLNQNAGKDIANKVDNIELDSNKKVESISLGNGVVVEKHKDYFMGLPNGGKIIVKKGNEIIGKINSVTSVPTLGGKSDEEIELRAKILANLDKKSKYLEATSMHKEKIKEIEPIKKKMKMLKNLKATTIEELIKEHNNLSTAIGELQTPTGLEFKPYETAR